MARSRWKLNYFSKSIWRKISIVKKNKRLKKRITFDRSSNIPSCFIFRYFRVHKGRRGRSVYVNMFLIGKKFGEFSFTRKPFYYPAKKSKKKKNNFIRR